MNTSPTRLHSYYLGYEIARRTDIVAYVVIAPQSGDRIATTATLRQARWVIRHLVGE